jgi:N-acetylglucosamine-6-phosphate deacetylase
MPRALENLIHLFGLRAEDACAMCTRTPADSIGAAPAGRIAPGAPAVLTRWTREWRMAGVITDNAD